VVQNAGQAVGQSELSSIPWAVNVTKDISFKLFTSFWQKLTAGISTFFIFAFKLKLLSSKTSMQRIFLFVAFFQIFLLAE